MKRNANGLNSILLINTKAASQHFKTGSFLHVSLEAQQHISRSLTGVPRFSGHISGHPSVQIFLETSSVTRFLISIEQQL